MTNTCPIFSKHLAQTDHFVKLTNKSILSQYNKSSCSFISEAFHTASRKYSGHKIIYTDCAKGEQWCGCAILYRNNVVRCLLSEMFSVLTEELYASLYVIEIATSEMKSNILICTDWLSSISSLRNTHKLQHPLVVKNPYSCCASYKEEITWIPDHKKVGLNNVVDKTAKESAILTPVPNPPIPATTTYFMDQVRDHVKRRVTVRFSSSSQFTADRKKTSWMIHPNGKYEVALLYIRSLHITIS